MKFATFIKYPPQVTRDAFQSRLAAEYMPALGSSAPTIRGCVVREVRESPGTPMDAMAPPPSDPFGQFDMLVESWFSSVEDFRRELLPLDTILRNASAEFASYSVTPRLQLDPRIREAGANGRRPEMTVICMIQWRNEIPRQVASEMWARHAGVALRCQTTVSKYEQNVVDEALSWTSGSQLIDAYADFSAPSIEDCKSGFVATREERQDTGRFVARGRFSYLDDASPVLR